MSRPVYSQLLVFALVSMTAAVALFPTLAHSQNPEWMVYNQDNSELPNNDVWALAIDAEGNAWIGTYRGGLAKFDGANWRVHTTDNSGLPDNYVRALAIDAQGNIWIGTDRGLAKFDREDWTIYDTDNLVSSYPTSVHALAIDTEENIWIGIGPTINTSATVGGLAKFDGENWTVYSEENPRLADAEVHALVIDAQGIIWVGTWDLGKFDGEEWTVYTTDNSPLPEDFITALAIDKQGNKWIGTACGLAKFDGENWTVYNKGNSGLPNNCIRVLAIDEQGNKWIGTEGGLAKFDGKNWSVYTTGNSRLPGNFVISLAIDAQGNTWIGTYGGGLAVYREGGVNLSGMTDVEERRNAELPSAFSLSQNYPNPFNATTGMSFSVATCSYVNMAIYNVLGQVVRELADAEYAPGVYHVRWDGTDSAHTSVSSGFYLVRMTTDEGAITQKMIFLREFRNWGS